MSIGPSTRPLKRHGAERVSHFVFVATLLAKGLLGIIQIGSALAIAFGVLDRLPKIARWYFQTELGEDPRDPIASKFIALADKLPGTDATFYGIYFTAHGMLHLGVVICLLLGLMWAYPVGIAVLAAFIVYQTVEFFTVGGWILWVLSAIDLVVIILTYHEWQVRRAAATPPPTSKLSRP